jgi:hypothetical protein
MPTMSTSVPSTSGLKGAPGASMQRVTNSFGRESAGVSAVFVVPAFRRVIAEIQSQDSKPETLIPHEPFDVGRTWASLLWPLSKINKQNAVRYRMALPLGTSSAKKSTLLSGTLPFWRVATNSSGRGDNWREQRLRSLRGFECNHDLSPAAAIDEDSNPCPPSLSFATAN